MESLSRFGLTVVKDGTGSCLTHPARVRKGVCLKSNCQEKKRMRVSKNN